MQSDERTRRRQGDTIAIGGDYQHRARTEGMVVQRFWHYEKERIIRKFSPPSPGQRVVDVGCGSGVVSDLLASMGARTTGVDGNATAIDYARKTFVRDNLDFRLGLVQDLDFAPASLDRIYCIEVIEHLYQHEGDALLSHFAHLTRPGGVLTLTTPNYRSAWPLIEYGMDRLHLAPPMAEHQHVSRFNPRSLTESLTRAGWRVQRMTTFATLAPFLSVVSWKLAERCADLEDRIESRFGNIILAVATRG